MKSSRVKDRTGERHGFWTFVEFAKMNAKYRALWLIRCDCGATRVADPKHILSGTSKSCGCGLHKRTEYPIKHGHYVNGRQTPEYYTWAAMLRRVRNPRNNRYQYYGGIGIYVCERWLEFANFFADMGPRPGPHYSIERRDGKGNYEPDNCYWATIQEQNWNKSNNLRILVDGRIKNVGQCEQEYGISAALIRGRIYNGWPGDRAVKTPRR